MGLNNSTNNAASKALQMMKRIRKLQGTALISSGILLHEDCTKGTDTKLFTQSVLKLVEGLGRKGEYPENILLKYDGGEVLLMLRYPVILCLFFTREDSLEAIEKSGGQFLEKFSNALGITARRPRPSKKSNKKKSGEDTSTALILREDIAGIQQWEDFRKKLEVLLSKVLGSAQSNRLILRELKAMGIDTGGFIRANQFRPFGQKIIQKIRDKKVRREINDELINLIENLT